MEMKTDVEVVKPLRENENVKNDSCKNQLPLCGEESVQFATMPKLEKGGVFNAVNNCTL